MAEGLGNGLQNRVHQFKSGSRLEFVEFVAGVAELADAQDLKSCILRGVRVQLPPPAFVFWKFLRAISSVG